jgi:hypothetical protein
MPERDESLRRRHLDEVIESNGFAVIVERINKMLEAKQLHLQGDLDAIETAKCRGEIKALNDVLRVPSILQKELQHK